MRKPMIAAEKLNDLIVPLVRSVVAGSCRGGCWHEPYSRRGRDRCSLRWGPPPSRNRERNALTVPPARPDSRFRDRRRSPTPGTIDLKKPGARLFVMRRGSFPLRTGVTSSTVQRLRQAGQKLGWSSGRTLGNHRRFQLHPVAAPALAAPRHRARRPGDNRVNPDQLKLARPENPQGEAFRQARKIQLRLKLTINYELAPATGQGSAAAEKLSPELKEILENGRMPEPDLGRPHSRPATSCSQHRGQRAQPRHRPPACNRGPRRQRRPAPRPPMPFAARSSPIPQEASALCLNSSARHPSWSSTPASTRR